MTLSPNSLTFDAMHSAYSAVLQSQPGKALRLPDGGAVFLEEGNVYAATLSETGEVEMETAGCISPVAWDDDRGCWDCDESAEVCVSAVNSPVFINLPEAENVFELPATWTGKLHIRGCVEVDGCVEEAADCDAEFFGVYAQTAHGLHMWVEDCTTHSQASDIADFLKSTF